MKEVFKTYFKFTAAALTIVFGIQLMMPVTIYAADFFCSGNAEIGAFAPANDSCEDCSDVYEEKGVVSLSDGEYIGDHCLLFQICKQTVVVTLTDIQSIQPVKKQVKPIFSTTPSYSYLSAQLDNFEGSKKISLIFSESTYPYSVPPVYLMNSTFLN